MSVGRLVSKDFLLEENRKGRGDREGKGKREREERERERKRERERDLNKAKKSTFKKTLHQKNFVRSFIVIRYREIVGKRSTNE